MLFGSTLFGIIGALLAIPIAATLQIGLREYLEYRREIRARVEEGPAILQPPQPPPDRHCHE